MFDTGQLLPLIATGVLVLIGLGSCLAWLPARRLDPAGLPARIFVTAGLALAVVDTPGLGSVLGLSLAAMGALVMWQGQPAPHVPRPRRAGVVGAAVTGGLATLATAESWGPLGQIPDELHAVATAVVAAVTALAALAVADRSRVTLREKLAQQV